MLRRMGNLLTFFTESLWRIPSNIALKESRNCEWKSQRVNSLIKEIVFLGTCSMSPLPLKRNNSGIAFKLSSGKVILCDCGEATQHQIMRSNSIKAGNIDMILITHMHGDHFFGIFGLLCTIAGMGRVDPITIVGPKGIKETVCSVFTAQGGFSSFPLHFVGLEDEGTVELGQMTDGVTVSAHRLKHGVPTYGYVMVEPDREGTLDATKAHQLGAKGPALGQLKAGNDIVLANGEVIRSKDCVGPTIPGRKIVLLQDTCESSTALSASMDCDLLIHEATYHGDLQEKAINHGHSTALMAGAFGRAVRAKTLVLTHFSARYKTKCRIADNPEELKKAMKNKEIFIEDLVEESAAAINDPNIEVIAAEDFLRLRSSVKSYDGFRVPITKRNSCNDEGSFDVDPSDPNYQTTYVSSFTLRNN